MIQIYICEDEKAQLYHLTELIKKLLLFSDDEIALYCAVQKPEVLLEKRKETKEVGLYFLDIDLQANMNGLELAKQIRALDPRGYIVFITTHGEMLIETFAYQVEALGYILKDQPELLEKKVGQCIQSALLRENTREQQQGNSIPVKQDNRLLRINQSDILYVESGSMSHKVAIYTVSGIRQAPGSLKSLQDSLDGRFYPCRSSVLVNIDHVDHLQPISRKLIMDNGAIFTVSTRLLPTIRQALEERPK